MIKLQNIEYRYDDNNVLDNINLSIHSGDFMGIVGADDSGKTTLLHILLGFKHPDSGSVSVFGQNVDNLSEIIRNNIRFVYDDIIWEENITANDYFNFIKKYSDKYDDIIQLDMCEDFNIDVNEELLNMTYNDNKLVSIIAAISSCPEILVLDEPYNYLNDNTCIQLLEYLKDINNSGMTIIITAEKYNQIQYYCTCYAYLKDGKLISSDSVMSDDIRWKAITVRSGNINILENYMSEKLSDRNGRVTFLYKKSIKLLLRLVSDLECADISIEDVSLEEELDNNFSRWM